MATSTQQQVSSQELQRMTPQQLSQIATENISETFREVYELVQDLLRYQQNLLQAHQSGQELAWDPSKGQRVKDEVEMINARLQSFATIIEALGVQHGKTQSRSS